MLRRQPQLQTEDCAGFGIALGQAWRPNHCRLVAAVLGRADDFSRNEQAGEIVGELSAPQPLKKAERARHEDCVEEIAWRLHRLRGANAGDEPLPVFLARLHQAPKNRVITERGEDFAGHISPKSYDPPGLDLRPFRMGARENEEAVDAFHCRESAKNLRLLASHHIRPIGRSGVEHAGSDGDLAKRRRLDRHNGRRRLAQTRRAADIGRFAPALARANHAGKENGRSVRRIAPRLDRLSQRGLMLAWLDAENAPVRFDLIERRAVFADQIGPEGGRTPIDADERNLIFLQMLVPIIAFKLRPQGAPRAIIAMRQDRSKGAGSRPSRLLSNARPTGLNPAPLVSGLALLKPSAAAAAKCQAISVTRPQPMVFSLRLAAEGCVAAMIADLLTLVTLALFPALMAFSASSDLFTMTIPNRISIALVLAYPALAVAVGVPITGVAVNFTCGFAVLALTFAMYSRGWIGGGDAKLAAATALWLGWALLLDYGLITSVLGGVITLGIVFARRAPLPAWASRLEWVARLHNPSNGAPYGIALAAAGLLLYPSSQIWLAAGGL